jgi:hypothetical protein
MILESKPNPANHWVSFALEGSPKNRLSLNARIRITTGKLQQLREVRSGGSYLSQNDLHLYFGLGAACMIDKVEFIWPNGGTQAFTGIEPDHFYSLRQNEDLIQSDKSKSVHCAVSK